MPQFRGGGKFCAYKQLAKTKLNRKLKNLALKSCMAIKRASGTLEVVNSVHDVSALASTSLLIHAASRSRLLSLLSLRGLRCVH